MTDLPSGPQAPGRSPCFVGRRACHTFRRPMYVDDPQHLVERTISGAWAAVGPNWSGAWTSSPSAFLPGRGAGDNGSADYEGGLTGRRRRSHRIRRIGVSTNRFVSKAVAGKAGAGCGLSPQVARVRVGSTWEAVATRAER
jgi:hypothetical protein